MDSTKTRDTLSMPVRVVRSTLPAPAVAVGLLFFFVLTGINGFRGGWLWAPLITTPAMAALGWFGWGAQRARVPVTAVFAAAGIAFGLWASQEAVLSPGRLHSEMNSIKVPSSFEKVGDERNGIAMCFDVCTSFSRTWVAPGSPEETRATVARLLEQQGFVLGSWRDSGRPGDMAVRGHRGRLGASVSVSDRASLKDGQGPTAPAGQVVVTVQLETYSGNPL